MFLRLTNNCTHFENKTHGCIIFKILLWAPNALFSLFSVYITFNINWRDVQRKNVANNVDMISLRAPWQNGLYEKKNRTTQKHVEHQDATDIQKKNIFGLLFFFRIFLFVFIISLMISPSNVDLPPWYGQWLSLGF